MYLRWFCQVCLEKFFVRHVYEGKYIWVYLKKQIAFAKKYKSSIGINSCLSKSFVFKILAHTRIRKKRKEKKLQYFFFYFTPKRNLYYLKQTF